MKIKDLLLLGTIVGVPLVAVGVLLALRRRDVILEGKVTDVDTGDPIAGVSITVDGKETASRSDGSYSIDVALGSYTLTAEKVNFETYIETIDFPEKGSYTKNIPLKRVGAPGAIPVAIRFPESPVYLTQFYRSWVSTRDVRQHLRVYPCIDEACSSEEFGYVNLMGLVVDATGRGVANIPVLVWHSAVPDREGGSLNLFGTVRTASNPLLLYSGSDGSFSIKVGYKLPIEWVRKHCHFVVTGEVPKPCTWYWCLPFQYIACNAWETLPMPYSVFGQIQGTTIMGVGFITTNSKST